MKICLIGNRGHWGYVFESIKDIPDAAIVAISPGCADNIDNMAAMCSKFDFAPRYYAAYSEMLDQEHPDLVVIDGPFDLHARMSIECLKRNIHVFCEKPIALTLNDLAQVESAYRDSRGKIFSMIGLRYEAPFQAALQQVKAGAIGKVKMIYARKSYKLGTRPEFYKKRSTYGGTIPWVGSHAFDWIMAFSACNDFAKCSAVDTNKDNFNNGELEIAAVCQIIMKNGVFAQASLDYLRPMTASTHGDDQVRVAGTQGIIEVRQGKVFLINDSGEREIPAIAERHLFSDIALDCIGKRMAMTSPEETIALTRNCLMAQQIADRNRIGE